MREETDGSPALLYAKLTLSLLLVAYLVAFMVTNTRNEAIVWLLPFMDEVRLPTLLVIVITAVISTVGWWLAVQLRRTWKRRRAGAARPTR